MAIYPGAIPTLDEIFKAIDYVDWTNAAKWNKLRAELQAALVELGTLPKGSFADVKTRLEEGGPLSRCGVYLSADQAINTTTWAKIELDTEHYDNQNDFDPATNYRFTAQKAGLYLIVGSLTFKTLDDEKVGVVSIYVNGTDYERGQFYSPGANLYINAKVTVIKNLAANDYVELWGQHNNGDTQNFFGSSAHTYLYIHKLS